ncbi:MAG: hypothetical protein K9I94_01865 [Bacteroidales bacterium]|nr:hypothetical protein [Bacteroidales bacterium]
MYTANNISKVNEDLILEYLKVPSDVQRIKLKDRYDHKFRINKSLNRSLISFQANKSEPLYRWFKFKEGFSSAFVNTILAEFSNPQKQQVILDPFAGIGTTLTTSLISGHRAIGIELLKPAILAAKARIASHQVKQPELNQLIIDIETLDFYDHAVEDKYFFKHITITKGAFLKETEIAIANVNKYLSTLRADSTIRQLAEFAMTSVLEDISFTRKDGQYLRWDYRADRNLKSKFSKGEIHELKQKLLEKLYLIREDIFASKQIDIQDYYELYNASSLEKIHDLEDESVDLVITSPPYCNRYDYTRTYALELAYNGVDDQEIKKLRQTLLSATVENKSKYNILKEIYTKYGKQSTFDEIVGSFRKQAALNESIAGLYYHRNKLNNKNIPYMVSNYFFEMNFIIWELERVLKKGGKVVMVNDNVRYNGSEIPVDLILSEFAADAGLYTDVIWILEKGKGNSSQQMGAHGRKETRKCVYVWSK